MSEPEPAEPDTDTRRRDVPASPIDAAVDGTRPPADLDPLASGVLMAHQAAWVADQANLKAAEKGRRTGITFAEALDATLLAATKPEDGGDNVFYIGDTQDKGREFIAVVARFAAHVAAELADSAEEFLFEDTRDDGSSKYITAYRVRFASGYQVAGLSSRPANIRGLQGRVVIDEAAFHADPRGVIEAANALLIWGGQIRIISTHNGVQNPFNELLKEIRAGTYPYSLHRITFDDAVENGLYERVCRLRGWTATVEGKRAWYHQIRKAYGHRVEAEREELDAVPREGEGTAIALAWIDACARRDHAVRRWAPPAEGFVDWPRARREREIRRWLDTAVLPALEALPNKPVDIGEDFGMRNDRTVIAVGYTGQDLTRHVPLVVELDRCPYAQQRQVFAYIAHRVRLRQAYLDANGNGMPLAQEMRQELGAARVREITASDAWYRENGAPFADAFADRTIAVPADLDVRNDLHQLRVINGVTKLPREVRQPSRSGGGQRHGDAAIALMLFHAASLAGAADYGYHPAPAARPLDEGRAGERARLTDRPDHSDDLDAGGAAGAW